MRKNILIAITFVICFCSGLYFGDLLASMNFWRKYTCGDIAHFHFDLLMKKYGVTASTDKGNPNRDINQRAGEVNGKLLEICTLDIRDETIYK